MDAAAEMAARLAGLHEIAEPWPHGVEDDFLPPDLFAELLASLPDVAKAQNSTQDLPASVLAVLKDPRVEAAIRSRFGFTAHKAQIELTCRRKRIAGHSDRQDKAWSGIVYLAGDPVGTELYDTKRVLAKVVEFKPNRLLCWGKRGEQHAVPESQGRFAIQWWFLK